MHLSKLLGLDKIVSGSVPSKQLEAARDLLGSRRTSVVT
jgi:hypothetical protein